MFKDHLLEAYKSFHPIQYTSLDELLIRQDTPHEGTTSHVSIKMILSGGGIEIGILHLSFYGVVNLQVNLLQGYNQVGLVNIVPMQDRQWEYIDYAVRETENNLFSFYCKTFEVHLEQLSIEE